MVRYKPYDYGQALLLPVGLQDQLIAGTLEFAIQTLVESRMVTSVFYSQFINDDTTLAGSRGRVSAWATRVGRSLTGSEL